MKPVVIYTSQTCGPCASLKKYLDHKAVAYMVRDINEHPRWAKIVHDLTGRLIVPVTVIGDKVVSGLNYAAIAKALDERL